MKKYNFSRALIGMMALVTLSFAGFGFTRNFGLDSYEIWLNDRSLMKGYVNQPLDTRLVTLDKNATGNLHVGYTHCMNKTGGTARSLTLKDENGQSLHKWNFADGAGTDQKMDITVKELAQLDKKNTGHSLRLYYMAREMQKEEMLALVRFK